MSKRKLEPDGHDDGISPSLTVLLKLIGPKDEATLYYACRALNHLLEDANGKRQRIQSWIDAGICSKLVQLVGHPSNQVAIAAIHIVRHIIEMGETEIQAIIDAKIIPRLVYHIERSDNDIKKEAAWVIEQTLNGGCPKQKRHLVEEGCIIPAFCGMLSSPEAETLSRCLAVLMFILDMWILTGKQDAQTSLYEQRIKECGGFDKIKKLATCENPAVREEAVKIISIYFK